ncbi:MAG TPA: PAS domain S-box protein [Candidatus Acidoferrum sp.]|nr:PAS domain S-box protein [Candidatus Acidoferrum sp.]
MSKQDAQQLPKATRMQGLALPVDSSRKLAASLSEFLRAAKSLLRSDAARVAASLLIVAVSYYLAAKISLHLRFSGSTKAALWPNNAILVATLLLTPVRRWWMYLLAVIPAHMLVHSSFHIGAMWMAFQMGQNTVLSVAAAGILKRLGPSLFSFDHLHDVLVFLGTAILVPGAAALGLVTAVNTIASEETIRLHGWPMGFWPSVSRIWLTNTVSFVVFVPLFLLIVSRWRFWMGAWSRKRLAEGSALGVLLLATGYLIFGSGYASSSWEPATFLLSLPLLLWAAIRFGAAGNSLAIAAVVCVSFWRAYRGDGPFAQDSAIAKIESMQLFWILLTVPLMALAAMIQEHKFASEALAESENRFRQLFEQASVGVALESLEGKLAIVNPAFCAMFGYTEAELHELSCAHLSHPEDVPLEAPLLRELCAGTRKSYQIDKRFFRKDGTIVWGRVSVSLLKPQDGSQPFIIGMLRDISALKQRDQELVTLTGRLIEAQEEERRRISRELHDDIGQQAAAIAADLCVLRDAMGHGASEPAGALADMVSQMATELASSVHKLSHELHSSRLQYLGLASALKDLCDKLAAQHDLTIELSADCLLDRLPEPVELCMYRIAQEALSNVVKHSEATTALVKIAMCGRTISLCVADDGLGFDTNAARGGIGLTSMRERLRLVGGELFIKSSAETGTELVAEIQLPARKAAAAD